MTEQSRDRATGSFKGDERAPREEQEKSREGGGRQLTFEGLSLSRKRDTRGCGPPCHPSSYGGEGRCPRAPGARRLGGS